MNTMLNNTNTRIDQLTQQAANKAEHAISATQRTTDAVLDQLQDGVNALRGDAPGALSRATAKVEALTSQGMEQARQIAGSVRDRAEQTGDQTVRYIRDEPVKSVLIAAAAGAALAAVVGLLVQRRDTRN